MYYADLGSQIRGSDKVYSDISSQVTDLDNSKMQNWAAGRYTVFNFGVPHYPQGQGAVERLVAEIKKELINIVGTRTFTFGQLDSVLAECSYLVNCRPLQLNPGPGGEDSYLCPNDFLMGRSDKSPAMGEFEATSLTKKIEFQRSTVLQFWQNVHT